MSGIGPARDASVARSSARDPSLGRACCSLTGCLPTSNLAPQSSIFPRPPSVLGTDLPSRPRPALVHLRRVRQVFFNFHHLSYLLCLINSPTARPSSRRACLPGPSFSAADRNSPIPPSPRFSILHPPFSILRDRSLALHAFTHSPAVQTPPTHPTTSTARWRHKLPEKNPPPSPDNWSIRLPGNQSSAMK